MPALPSMTSTLNAGTSAPRPRHSSAITAAARAPAAATRRPAPGMAPAMAAAAALMLACSQAPALAAVMPPAWSSVAHAGLQQVQLLAPATLPSPTLQAPAAADFQFPPPTQQRRLFVSFARQVTELMKMGYTYVDVRTPEAYAAGHVPGSVNIPYSPELPATIEARYGKTEPIIIGCKAGKFSAKSMLLLADFNAVEYRGGFDDWVAAGSPVAK